LNKIALIYSNEYLKHETGEHPESPARVKRAYERIISSNAYSRGLIKVIEPNKVNEKILLTVHTSELIEAIRELSECGGGLIAPDTVVSRDSYEVALLAVGGAIKALELIMKGEFKKAFALIRPPGHHAERDRAKGFCLFNNVAITAQIAISRGFNRILILDWDAHHGDGTQSIFYENPKVLYISVHQDGRTLYPGTGFIDEIGSGEGEGYNVNIPLPPKANGALALYALREVAVPIIEQFKPEIVMVSAGYDAHHADMISDLNFTLDTYYEMTKMASKIASRHAEGRIIIVLEGGYHLKYMPMSIVNTICALVGIDKEHSEREYLAPPAVERYVNLLIKRMKKILSKYWAF